MFIVTNLILKKDFKNLIYVTSSWVKSKPFGEFKSLKCIKNNIILLLKLIIMI